MGQHVGWMCPLQGSNVICGVFGLHCDNVFESGNDAMGKGTNYSYWLLYFKWFLYESLKMVKLVEAYFVDQRFNLAMGK